MKLFLSWSGDQSRLVAEAFSEWIQCVIQASRPWISTRDIERGSVWFSEISDQLKDTSIGIIFLTEENKNKPWILFEAGALAKGLTNSRVCTFLINLTPGDIQDPLAQFNHTKVEKSGLWGLVRTINAALLIPIEEKILDRIFETYWPRLEGELNKIKNGFTVDTEVGNKKFDDSEALVEILSGLKTISNRIARLERDFSLQNMEHVTPNHILLNARDNMYLSNEIDKRNREVETLFDEMFEKLMPLDMVRSTLKSFSSDEDESRRLFERYRVYRQKRQKNRND